MSETSAGRRALLIVAAAAGSFVYGLFTAQIPSPRDVGVFWVSNLSAPWLALAFLAGWLQQSRLSGALAGACANVACVVGFYAGFLHFADPRPWGLSPAAPLAERVMINLGHWVAFAAPWLLAGLVAGAAFGVVGAYWGRSRARGAGMLLAAAFIFEPAAWYLHNEALWQPHVIWLVEIAFGVLLLAYVLATMRRGRGAT